MRQFIRFCRSPALAACLWLTVTACSDPPPTVNPVRVTDVNQMEAMLTSTDFSGLVAVMASWCPPCREELPLLEKAYNTYKGKNITILALSVDADGASAVQPLINELGVTFPVFWVGTDAIRQYKISGVPTLLVIRNGVMVKKIPGGLPRRAISSVIESLMAAPRDPNAV